MNSFGRAAENWLARDYTGKPLSALEERWVGTLQEMLEKVKPPQVDSAETIRTHEGQECLICVLPHRSLGGLSIITTLRGGVIQVSWAQVATLSYHDDFDLARHVAEIELGDPVEQSLKEAARVVETQLRRPVVLQVWRGAGKCFLREGDRLQRVAVVGSGLRRVVSPFIHSQEEHEIRFTDAASPPIIHPSKAAAWVRRGRANA